MRQDGRVRGAATTTRVAAHAVDAASEGHVPVDVAVPVVDPVRPPVSGPDAVNVADAVNVPVPGPRPPRPLPVTVPVPAPPVPMAPVPMPVRLPVALEVPVPTQGPTHGLLDHADMGMMGLLVVNP